MADEALNCFTTLLESVPTWIADLENILKTATERQNEILFENQPAEPARTSFRSRKTSKTSSLKSHRSEECAKDIRDALPDASSTTLLRPQLPHLSNSDALRLSQRKRKTVSVCSGEQPGPSKFRSRSMVVIYYDGDVQKQFETLVRAVGTCRNGIRKGKMSLKVDSLSRTGSSSSEASNSGDEDERFVKLNYKPSRPRRTGGGLFGRDDGTEAFDKVDGLLEKAQGLCERAAHQVLRDGDCALELRNAKEHFESVVKTADAELPALHKRAARAIERRRRSDERRRVEEEAIEKRKQNKSVATVEITPTPSSDSPLEVDLEADDSDADDDELKVKMLRSGRYHLRNSGLMAH